MRWPASQRQKASLSWASRNTSSSSVCPSTCIRSTESHELLLQCNYREGSFRRDLSQASCRSSRHQKAHLQLDRRAEVAEQGGDRLLCYLGEHKLLLRLCQQQDLCRRGLRCCITLYTAALIHSSATRMLLHAIHAVHVGCCPHNLGAHVPAM